MKKCMKRICIRCGNIVLPETGSLRKEYPFYCPECDENMYEFETELVEENLQVQSQS